MPFYVVLAALAVAVSVPILVLALASDRAPGRRVSQNLNAGLAGGVDLRAVVLSQSAVERLLQPLVRALGGRARRFTPAGAVSALERKVELSGAGWSLEQVLAAKVAFAGMALTAGLVWAASALTGTTLLAAGAGAAVGFLAPDAVLSRKVRARQLAISNSLPDTLDQLTICVEAGLGFDSALARVAHSGSGPLGQEISITLKELRVGVPRSEALDNLVVRTEVPEIRQFVHAVTQAEIYGVPITGVLRSQALEQREKRRFRAEERAMKLPVKVIFPLVFCILPTMFIVILGPAALSVLKVLG